MLAADLDEGLVGALHDALRADIDPRAGRHLAVHHQALAVELVELVPGRPVRHEVGVGDQHARRVGVGAEHADRLAGLDEQRLVVAERPQRGDDAVEALPVARRPADAAIDDQFAGLLGHLGSRLFISMRSGASVSQLLARELGAARRADDGGNCRGGSCGILGVRPGAGKGEAGLQESREHGAHGRAHGGVVRHRPDFGRRIRPARRR